MRTRQTLSILGIVAALTSSAQHAEIQWGREYQERTDGEFRMVMSVHNDASYLWLQRKEEQLIAKLGPDLALVYAKEVDQGMQADDRRLARILPLDDRFIVFTTKYDKRADKNELFARIYAEADYTPMGERRRVAAINVEDARDIGRFNIDLLPGRKGIRIGTYAPGRRGEATTGTVHLDLDLNEVPAAEPDGDALGEPAPGEGMTIVKHFRTKGGALLYLVQRQPTKKGEPPVQLRPDEAGFWLARADADGEWHKYPIALGGHNLQDAAFREDANGDILCSGSYGGSDGTGVGGVFFLRLDPADLRVRTEDHHDFSDAFITEGLSGSAARQAERKADRRDEELEMPGLRMDPILERPGGGWAFSGEAGRSYQICTEGRYGTICSDHHIYNDAVFATVDANGHIAQAVKVPKRQHLRGPKNDLYGSYRLVTDKENLYVVFNDRLNNLGLEAGKRPSTFDGPDNGSATMLMTIGPDGQKQEAPLLGADHNGKLLAPTYCATLSGSRLLVCLQDGSSYRFGIVSFH
ncbi:MAG: hypothetical protein QM724_09305 [Flavobacteriales bacterium]